MAIPTAFSDMSFAPAPNTTTAGTWGEFVNEIVRGTTQIIQSVKSPTGQPVQGGWAGTGEPLPADPSHVIAPSSNLFGLLVVIGVLILVAKG